MDKRKNLDRGKKIDILNKPDQTMPTPQKPSIWLWVILALTMGVIIFLSV